MDEMSQIERLLALNEIEELMAQRVRAADTKDWALYEALHVPDYRAEHDDQQPWTSAPEMIANVRRIMGHMTTVHHAHTPQIAFESPVKATGVWAMKGFSSWRQAGEDHWALAFGHYFETYEKRGGKWLFTSRSYRYYHQQISPGGVFPSQGRVTQLEQAGCQE
jgi:hypothetical protein